MAVIVETGAVVTNANSFVTTAFVLAYLTARNSQTLWEAADTEVQEAAVLRAGDYLKNEERFPFRGARVSYVQTMPWPRTGASERRGPAIPSNVIPWRLMDAQAELASRALSNAIELQPDLARGGKIKSEAVDVISTTYADDAPAETSIPVVMGLLAPLLRTKMEEVTPYHAAPAVLTPFAADDFTNT